MNIMIMVELIRVGDMVILSRELKYVVCLKLKYLLSHRLWSFYAHLR